MIHSVRTRVIKLKPSTSDFLFADYDNFISFAWNLLSQTVLKRKNHESETLVIFAHKQVLQLKGEIFALGRKSPQIKKIIHLESLYTGI